MEKLVANMKQFQDVVKQEKNKLFQDVKKSDTNMILFPHDSYDRILQAKEAFIDELNRVLDASSLSFKKRKKMLKIFYQEIDTHLVYMCAAMNLYQNIQDKKMKQNIKNDYKNFKQALKLLKKKLKK
jgi:hypothetical protein